MTAIVLEPHKDDDDVVASQSRQILQKTSVMVSYPIYQKINRLVSKLYPNSKYLGERKAKAIDHIFSLGVDQAEKELENPILFDERKPRADVMVNLGKIASELLKLSEYPTIRAVTLMPTINKVMPFADKRTKAKYLKCIQQYIDKPGEFNLTDVSGFIVRMPKEFLNTTTSTSSS